MKKKQRRGTKDGVKGGWNATENIYRAKGKGGARFFEKAELLEDIKVAYKDERASIEEAEATDANE